EMVEVSGIGVVIPGIIANTIQKQGVVITLSSTMLLTCITYVILFLYSFIN
ncbi:MAG: poly-gamma-glutamate biosynthesis protein PgsC/CapC, partial [Staphylococcus warneri]|nr:poly-gamma-glutamate biosynthesis protein PgsC/CapC [Staphylococcus warneri]